MPPPNELLPTIVLPAALEVVGDLAYPGDIEILGSIDGAVRCRRAVIRPGAHFVGIIVAETADIAGEVDADIYADTLWLRRGSAVVGEAYHARLQLEPGAVFEGKSRRHPAPRTLAPEPGEAATSDG